MQINLNNISCSLIILMPALLITGPFLSDSAVVLIDLIFIYFLFKEKKFQLLENNLLKIFLLFWIYISILSFFATDFFVSFKSSFFYFRYGLYVIAVIYFLKSVDDSLKTIYLIGNGVTYDSGGADLKVGGTMNGLKTDKGGAGACAGIMRAIAHIKPKGVKVIAYLGMVRNSIGSNAYVADEIIQGHSGRRVLVVNTDAEGRMVMADLLSLARTRIKKEKNNLLKQIARKSLTSGW